MKKMILLLMTFVFAMVISTPFAFGSDPPDYYEDIVVVSDFDQQFGVTEGIVETQADFVMYNHVIRLESVQIKYPFTVENNIYVNKFVANTDNSNLNVVLSFRNMTSVNANNYYMVINLPQNMNIEGLFRLEIGELSFCKTLCFNS